jgi:hypothetical protein
VTYTPASNYYGPDSFTYTIVDAQGNIASATVSVTVTNVADVPVANPDSATVARTAAHFIDVLGNDTDADNLSPTAPNAGLTVSGVGAAEPRDDGLHARIGVTYTPASDYYGPDSFTYTIVDAQGNIASATVSVTVTNVADVPVANPDSATVGEDSGAHVSSTCWATTATRTT